MTFDEWVKTVYLENLDYTRFGIAFIAWNAAIASTKQPEKQIPALFKPLVNPDEGY